MSPRQKRLLPWIALSVVYVVWGSTYMAIRIMVREIPPLLAGAIRFGTAGLVMTALSLVLDRDKGRPTLRQLAEYSVIGVLLLAVGNALVMWSEKTIPSGIAALIVATVPLWLTFFDGLRPGGQPWTLRVWLGTAIGLVGVALVARPQGGVQAGHWPGIIALQLATLSWTAGSLYSQALSRKLPVLTGAAVEMIAAGAMLFLESRFFGEDLGALSHGSGGAWLALLYLMVFGSLVGFTAFAYCLNTLPASTVGTYAYVNPVVAVALGSVFLGEALSASLLAGAALILVAVVLTTARRRAARARAAPLPAAGWPRRARVE